MSEILTAKSIRKVFHNGKRLVHAVNDVDLSIESSKIYVTLGPSGAGKSTLLHIIGGLDKPDKGTVTIAGIDLYRLSEPERAAVRNKKIGFVFQFYHLLPEFTALENVLLPALIAGCDKAFAQRRAYDLLDGLGLKNRAEHKPNQLSGGERQRVAIARSLINMPELLLCDEPTGNLDSESGRQIRELIWGLRDREKTAFLIVTHEPELAKGADRIFKMRDGMLEA